MTAARLVILLLVAAGSLAFYVPYLGEKQDERRLAEIASTIAGRDVTIDCPGTLATLTEISPHDGSVRFGPDGRPADVAKLSSGTCDRLRSVLGGDTSAFECLALSAVCPQEATRAAVAVNVLSHEAWHLAGERDEAVTQCYALQTNADTAIRLGATPAEARAIAAHVVDRVQPALPPAYRSRDCYDGGPLDLRPDHAGWP